MRYRRGAGVGARSRSAPFTTDAGPLDHLTGGDLVGDVGAPGRRSRPSQPRELRRRAPSRGTPSGQSHLEPGARSAARPSARRRLRPSMRGFAPSVRRHPPPGVAALRTIAQRLGAAQPLASREPPPSPTPRSERPRNNHAAAPAHPPCGPGGFATQQSPAREPPNSPGRRDSGRQQPASLAGVQGPGKQLSAARGGLTGRAAASRTARTQAAVALPSAPARYSVAPKVLYQCAGNARPLRGRAPRNEVGRGARSAPAS